MRYTEPEYYYLQCKHHSVEMIDQDGDVSMTDWCKERKGPCTYLAEWIQGKRCTDYEKQRTK